jgi:hypothetical protein
MHRESDLDSGRLKQLHEFIELLLRLRDRQAVTRHDDDRAGVAHEDRGVARIGRFRNPSLALHTASDPRVLQEQVRRVFAGIEPDIAISYMATAKDTMASNISTFILARRMLIEIAVPGLLLAAVGIFGVIANLVSEQTHEVGIRMALGARSGNVCWLFIRYGVRLQSWERRSAWRVRSLC